MPLFLLPFFFSPISLLPSFLLHFFLPSPLLSHFFLNDISSANLGLNPSEHITYTQWSTPEQQACNNFREHQGTWGPDNSHECKLSFNVSMSDISAGKLPSDQVKQEFISIFPLKQVTLGATNAFFPHVYLISSSLVSFITPSHLFFSTNLSFALSDLFLFPLK